MPASRARQASCQKIGGVSAARGPSALRSTVPSPLQSTSKPCSRDDLLDARHLGRRPPRSLSKKMCATVKRGSSAARGVERPRASSRRRHVGRGRSTSRPLPSPSPSTLPERWTIIWSEVRACSSIVRLGAAVAGGEGGERAGVVLDQVREAAAAAWWRTGAERSCAGLSVGVRADTPTPTRGGRREGPYKPSRGRSSMARMAGRRGARRYHRDRWRVPERQAPPGRSTATGIPTGKRCSRAPIASGPSAPPA